MSTRGRTPTPELAIRIAAFGIIAFGVFAILFLRLWFLQILQGDTYLARATETKGREVRVAAPRGSIIDRDGNVLVKNKVAFVVTLQADAIPEEDRARIVQWGADQGVYERRVNAAEERIRDAVLDEGRKKATKRRERLIARRVAQARRDLPARPRDLSIDDATPLLRSRLERVQPILRVSLNKLYQRVVNGTVRVPWAGPALKVDVSIGVRNYLLEQQARFPGIVVTKEYLRTYPHGALAAQIFGNVNQISEEQLKLRRYKDQGLRQGQKIGQSGLEYEYDRFLRGRDGQEQVEVDSQNRPTGEVGKDDPPQTGLRLRLTLSEALQRSAQFAIGETIRKDPYDDKATRQRRRAGGAFVAMDPRNGDILAIGSYPSVDLNRLSDPDLTQRQYGRLTSERSGAPLFNRAIAAQYPTGSTFKIVTGSAGLGEGLITPETIGPGGACIELSDREDDKKCNAGRAELPATNLAQSLEISSDVYYYDLGKRLYPIANQPLQAWARNYGFGRRTGIDLPGEVRGIVPDRAWRERRNQQELDCRKRERKPNCFLVGDVNGQFLLGDEVNFAIGQGDFLATPLQVAEAYAGLYDDPSKPFTNRLRFPVPRIARGVETADGVQEQNFPAGRARTVAFDAGWKRAIIEGLQGVTNGTSGTATAVFSDWDQTSQRVLGKTGTAQRCVDARGNSTCADQSWFAALVPDGERPIVVAVTVENGKFGTTTAAPIACKILRKWFVRDQAAATCAAGEASATQ